MIIVDWFKIVIEKLFFKTRYLYIKEELKNNSDCDYLNEISLNHVFKKNDLTKDKLNYLTDVGLGYLTGKEVLRRLDSENFILFLLTDEKKNVIAGSYWAFISKENESWYDSICIGNQQVILCNAYVSEEYRGRGLYSFLVRKSHQYVFENTELKKAFTIVEKSNIASNKVNKKYYGYVNSKNYLIKFMSINLFSIIQNADFTTIYFVPLKIKVNEK